MTDVQTPKLSGGVKFLLDFGPLVAFFFAVSKWGIMPATGVLMVGVSVSVLVHWVVERHIPKMLVFSALLILSLGGLTLWLDNPIFVKMKMTVLQVVIAAVLLGGMMKDKLFIKMLMGEGLKMSEAGWRIFTRNYAIFCLLIAAANEIIWRTQSDEFWAGFKSFGVLPAMLLFLIIQIMALSSHMEMDEAPSKDDAE